MTRGDLVYFAISLSNLSLIFFPCMILLIYPSLFCLCISSSTQPGKEEVEDYSFLADIVCHWEDNWLA